MNRTLLLLLGALALGTAMFAGSYVAARHTTMACCAQPDELGWLRVEFHLSDAELARIRALHEGYRPKCAAICAQIAAKKRELDAVLTQGLQGTNGTAGAQVKLNELAALRAQCQAQMLEHFVAVSQAMPPEPGRRYLAAMQQLTLGHHEQLEQTMSDAPGHEHHH